MKQLTNILLSLALHNIAFSQVNAMRIADSITNEGYKLYRSEMASWFGSDLFVERFKEERANIDGYFSFSDKGRETCLFYSKGDNPQVLGTISFDSTYNTGKAIVDGTKRDFTPYENEVYQLRKAALAEIEQDTALFKTYKNTNLNLIPFVEDDRNYVYILTGTSRPDIVIIGNDYLLNFNKTNKLISKRKLHANIIALPYGEEGKTDNIGSVHSHLPETGSFVTATDICTFLLYEKIAKWKQQLVISEKYMSIWNCETNKLIIVPTRK